MFDITSDTSVDITENTPMGEKVAVVLARDKDAGLNGLVRLVQRAFALHLNVQNIFLFLLFGLFFVVVTKETTHR